MLKPLIMTIYRLLAKIACVAICVLFTQVLFSQKVVTGKVNDDKGNPVQGATVTPKGSKTGTSTDAQGAFSLRVPSSATALVISSVGFTTTQVDITNLTSVSVSLTTTSTSLNDVVVTGYGTARRKDVTGAVASISSKDFTQGVVTDPLQQIQGKVAGLVITQPGGDPNQNVIIRLRGQASLTGGQSPLIVLDGVPLDDPTQLSNIPPGDIASYDVLKDASAAAIYGSRAANGVIIVNTKKGSSGTMKVEYNGFVGAEQLAKEYPLLNVPEWKQASVNLLTEGGLTTDSANKIVASYDHGGNTDWLKAITRTGFVQSHSIGISGGTGHFNYRGSVNYIYQDGIVINNNKEGIGLRFNAEQKALDDKLDIQIGIVNTNYTRHYTQYGNFDYIFTTPPTYPVYNPDGTFFAYSDFDQANPVEHLTQELNQGKENFSQLYGTVNYSILPTLKVGATGSLSHFNKQTGYYAPAFPVEGTVNVGNNYNYNTDSKKGDLHLNYNNHWGLHNFGFTGVYEYNYFTDDNFYAAGQQFLVDQNQNYALQNGNSSLNQIGSYKEEFLLISFLARATYNYNNKYYATASIRRDGSSKFGVNNRWGNFPSFDVAWAISQEEFLKNVSWLSYLKIRAGYGVTGNSEAITPYNTQFILGSVGRYFDPSAANQYPQSYAPTQNANPDLKWEERHGTNVGIDFSLFNHRLSGDFNVFSDKTKNLLYNYQVPVPPFYVPTILANVGDLTNKGLELSLNAEIVKGQHFSWNAGGQITSVQTKVTSLSGSYAGYKLSTDNIPGGYAQGRGLSTNPITVLKVGYAPYTFYLPHYEGVDQNGNQLFDSAGTKVPYNNAVYRYIDPSPKFTWGFNTTLMYDNWSLTIFLRGVVGQKVFNNTALDLDFIKRLPGNNVFKDATTNGIKDAATASDLYLENASYARLDNLTLGYTFNKVNPHIQTLKVYVTGNNLFVITGYKGLDPEIQNADTNQAYIDANYGGYGFFPRPRSYTFGVTLSFQ